MRDSIVKYPKMPKIRMGSAFREGRKHVEVSLGYQDSSFILGNERISVGIICDGCSKTDWGFSQNQFGAILGAEVLTNLIYSHILKKGYRKNEFPELLKESVNQTLSIFKSLIANIKNKGVQFSYNKFVAEKLTFTFIGIVTWKDIYWIFGSGNGCYGLNSDHEILPDNQQYLSKHLLFPRPIFHPTIYKTGSLAGVNFLWVSSDGFENYLTTGLDSDFNAFLTDKRTCSTTEDGKDETGSSFLTNIFNNKKNLFHDDITIIVFKNLTENTHGKNTKNRWKEYPT